jgi:hypothetical protein
LPIAHQRAHPGADGHAEERDEEEHAQNIPQVVRPHRVMVGDDPELGGADRQTLFVVATEWRGT